MCPDAMMSPAWAGDTPTVKDGGPDSGGQGMRRRLVAFLSVQVAVPLVLLVERVVTGEVDLYGWGWQMYSL